MEDSTYDDTTRCLISISLCLNWFPSLSLSLSPPPLPHRVGHRCSHLSCASRELHSPISDSPLPGRRSLSPWKPHLSECMRFVVNSRSKGLNSAMPCISHVSSSANPKIGQWLFPMFPYSHSHSSPPTSQFFHLVQLSDFGSQHLE